MPLVTVTVQNRHLTNIRLRDARVSIEGTEISAMTNAAGLARLNTTGLADGDHVLHVLPAHSTTRRAGPELDHDGATPDGWYRTLDVSITTRAGRFTIAAAANRLNGTVRLQSAPRLVVGLQPVFLLSPRRSPRTGEINLIVVHHTAGSNPIPPHFMRPKAGKDAASAHYVIPHDGQVVKLVPDGEVSNHAGHSRWKGVPRVNQFSIGIEIVHRNSPFLAAQYESLLILLGELRRAHHVAPEQIIGHCDVGLRPGTDVLGRKAACPGVEFDWTRLRGANLSLGCNRTAAASSPDSMYGGFFHRLPNGSLRRGDQDSNPGRKFGGAPRPEVTGNPIRELQDDLAAIGYSVSQNGVFDERTAMAVLMLQTHFHERLSPRNGQVNRITAEWIKSLA